MVRIQVGNVHVCFANDEDGALRMYIDGPPVRMGVNTLCSDGTFRWISLYSVDDDDTGLKFTPGDAQKMLDWLWESGVRPSPEEKK